MKASTQRHADKNANDLTVLNLEIVSVVVSLLQTHGREYVALLRKEICSIASRVAAQHVQRSNYARTQLTDCWTPLFNRFSFLSTRFVVNCLVAISLLLNAL